jgi:hypothetical protein
MKFEKLDIDGHLVLRVHVSDDDSLLRFVERQASQKSSRVHRDDPSGRTREPEEIENQNFLGTLADKVCAEILERYFRQHLIPARVIRYDDIRTDNFENPDLYDLKIETKNENFLVEVRSSVCIFLPVEQMLKKWQILGPYVSLTKGSTETKKPFYLRPIFHLTDFENNKKTQSYQRTGAVEAIASGNLALYFVGGATLEMLEQNGRNESGRELKQGMAMFKVLDITDGLDAREILQVISENIMN